MAPGNPPPDHSFTVSPEKREQMKQFGGRHYRGPGLRATPSQASWNCPNCGEQNTGRIELGCTACPAGRPQPAQETKPMPSAPLPGLRPAPSLSPKAAPINKQELLEDIRQIVREELGESLAGGFALSGKEAFVLRSLLDNIDIEAAAPEFATTTETLNQLRDRLVAYELEHPDTDSPADPGVPA